jgi:1-deoxy-D-xylulose-5-phosphate synthase
VIGGFGSCVLEACNERRLSTENIHRLALPDRWIYQGSRGDQQAEAGIDAPGIVRAVREIVGERAPGKRIGRLKAAG